MKQYLRGTDQPEGPTPPPEVLETISPDVDALNQKLKAAAVRGDGRLVSP
jgi:hypothetical protein